MKHVSATLITVLLAIQAPVQCAYSVSELPSKLWSKLPRTVQAAIPPICAIPSVIGLAKLMEFSGKEYFEACEMLRSTINQLIDNGIIVVPADQFRNAFINKVLHVAVYDESHMLRSYLDKNIFDTIRKGTPASWDLSGYAIVIIVIMAAAASHYIYNSDKAEPEVSVN